MAGLLPGTLGMGLKQLLNASLHPPDPECHQVRPRFAVYVRCSCVLEPYVRDRQSREGIRGRTQLWFADVATYCASWLMMSKRLQH